MTTTKTPAEPASSPSEPSRRPGRPRGSTMPPEDRKSAVIRVLATAAQKAAFHRLLGPGWLREQIDRAKQQ